MQQLPGPIYQFAASACVLLALQPAPAWAASAETASPYNQPAQAESQYPATHPANQLPYFDDRQYRSSGYPYPGRNAYPGYGRPSYPQPYHTPQGYPPAYDSSAPVQSASPGATATPAAEMATPGAPAQWLPTPLAAPADPAAPAVTQDTASVPAADPGVSLPAPAAGATETADPSATLPAPAAGTAEPEGLIEKTGAKVKEVLNTDESAGSETE